MRDKSAEKTIQIDVLLEFRDFLRANYWYLFKKLRLLFAMLFIGGIVYPVLYFAGAIGETTERQNYWGFLVIPTLLLLLLVSTYLGAKKQMKSNKGLQESTRYSFSEDGIDAVAASSSGHTSWSNIREAYETKNNFLLFISNNQMYTIPKRFFESGEQVNTFKLLLISELQLKAKLK